MAVKPHPSLLLILDIDEELDTKEQRLEIDRCYSYLGTPLVRTHPRAAGAAAAEGSTGSGENAKGGAEAAVGDGEANGPCNTVRLIVRLGTKRYWKASPETDALWHDVMETWLYNQIYKLSNQLKIYNRRQREEKTPELAFTWLEVDLENGAFTVRFRLDSTSGIPAEESTWITAVRNAVNAGELGEDVTEVTLPSEASYAEQRRVGLAAKAEREREAAEEEARQHAERLAEAQQREAEADELFLESPALAAQAAQKDDDYGDEEGMLLQSSGAAMSADGDNKTEGTEGADNDTAKTAEEIIAERIAEEENLSEELKRKYALPDPDFAIDYGTWTVHYADGTQRDYDPESKTFADRSTAESSATPQACAGQDAATPVASQSAEQPQR